MILLLGATSYFGRAFARELQARAERFIPLSRSALDYTRFELLFEYVRNLKPDFIINADSQEDGPDQEHSDHARTEMFQANTLLPQTVGRVCTMTSIPWGHVSSASIYSGAKVFEAGEIKVQRDLNTPKMRRLFASHPENFLGFTELDEPNFCFRSPPCTYNAGPKALADEWLAGREGVYIWRAGAPFDDSEEPANLLNQAFRNRKMLDHFVAVSHLAEFAKVCLNLLDRHAPFGTYNVTNPGTITTRQIASIIDAELKSERHFEFWRSETESLLNDLPAPQCSCILDSSKVLRAGVIMRPVRVAVEASINRWAAADGRNMTDGRDVKWTAGMLKIVR